MKASDPNAKRNPRSALVPMGLAGLVAIAAGGLAYGQFTHRWGGGVDVSLAAEAITAFPESFGPWRQQSSEPMDEAVLEMLRCTGYVNRSYLNVDTGEELRVAAIVGPAGPTAVHTPEICYSSRSFEVEHGPSKTLLDLQNKTHTFWKTTFSSTRPGGPRQIVYYAWTDDGVWNASDAPRYEYGGSPFLYKIQVAGMPRDNNRSVSDDLCKRFLYDLLNAGWTAGAATD